MADFCRKLTLIGLSASLLACAVGPDFTPPETPTQNPDYTAEPLPKKTAGRSGDAQTFKVVTAIPNAWWHLFRSKALSQLIADSLAASPTMAMAQANVRQAQALADASWGSLVFPQVDANPSWSRQKAASASLDEFGVASGTSLKPFTLYNASVAVSYSLDIWGGGRRELESLVAAADYQDYQLQAAYLTLTGNVVTTAVKEASLREQMKATRDIIAALSTQLKATQKQYQLGAISQVAVLAQRTALAQARATLPSLEKNLAQTRHQLAVLAGKLPSDRSLPQFHLSDFRLPKTLPITLPSHLVRQRPDILAAEALMHQAGAQVGVATAQLFPQINLSAADASEAATFSSLFSAGSNMWSVTAGLTQPIFHGGTLLAKRRASLAAWDAAKAQYQQTVLQGFQNVADSLRALSDDAEALRIGREAESFAKGTLNLSEKSYALGAASYLDLLSAEQQYQQAKINRVQVEALRYADTVALFQSLGGGWWHQ